MRRLRAEIAYALVQLAGIISPGASTRETHEIVWRLRPYTEASTRGTRVRIVPLGEQPPTGGPPAPWAD